MDGLAAAGFELKTAKLAEVIGYPLRTTERALEDLVAHGVAEVHRGGQGKANTWRLAAWAAQSYAIATSPEMSGGDGSTSPEMSGEASLLCTHTKDKSGEVESSTANADLNGWSMDDLEALAATKETAE